MILTMTGGSGEQHIDRPRAWQRAVDSIPPGLIMVIGAPDAGKSTFARDLFSQAAAAGKRVAFLDGDPGQSTLGPPATLTAALGAEGQTSFPPSGPSWRSFAGAVSPRGHMLEIVTGAARLAAAAFKAGARTVVYDTDGLVDPGAGGDYLKMAEIDLLEPTAVYAIQRSAELERLLTPLRLSRRTRVVDLPASRAARQREVPERQAHRAAQFAAYFSGARALSFDRRRVGVFPAPHFTPNRLAAFEDARGFVRGLGLVIREETEPGFVTLLTPLPSLDGVTVLRLGDVAVWPGTWRDEPT